MLSLRGPLTFSPLLDLVCPLDSSGCPLFFLLFRSASVKVLHDDSNKHVENKEADEKEKRDEIEQTPLVVILPWLKEDYLYLNSELFCKLTCWSIPTASRPWYMISTQPSLEDRTNNDINAPPRLSKLYF